MREITYYLVRRVNAFREAQYYCVTASGDPSTTENAKMAMRWLSHDPARQFANHLGFWWTAVAVAFVGDELCGLQPRVLQN